MRLFAVALLAATALLRAYVTEPDEQAMRQAFASDLADGVGAMLGYVATAGGPETLARIREARTDAFTIRAFRKIECHPSEDKPGHYCDFLVEVDTIAGPIARPVAGRFFAGPRGLAFDRDA
jgi:hypothetical protein